MYKTVALSLLLLTASSNAAALDLDTALVNGDVIQNHADREAIQCLTLNVYHEARGDGINSMMGVAHVTMNRAASPNYPDDVCAVVFERKQFSWTTNLQAAMDGEEIDELSEASPNKHNAHSWETSRDIARDIYFHHTPSNVGQSLFFHSQGSTPAWSVDMEQQFIRGTHVFY